MRESMVLYKGMIEALECVPDPDERWTALIALAEYAMEGKEPKLPWYLQGIFNSFRAQIDLNNKRYENGKKGGRPPKEKNQPITNPKPNHNQPITNPKPNVNVNDNENVNENVNEYIYSSPAASDTLSETEKVFEDLWCIYPNKRGKSGVKKASKEEIAKIGLEEMTRAVERYVAEWEENKSWQQMKNGNTFFNSGYKDYLDANYVPKPEVPKKAETRANRFCNFPQREWNFDEIERLETERRDKELITG